MRPIEITKLQARVIGGTDNNVKAMLFPQTLKEICDFFNEAKDFLATSDARAIEFTMINKEGAKELRDLYKNALGETKELHDMYKSSLMDATEVWTPHNVH
jgi:hypothetical protein